MTTLKKILSGGQSGADYAGLIAGNILGLETGGTAPKGWRICRYDGTDGSNPQLALFGLVEHASRDYPPRTKQNAADSDGTVWFGYAGSPGGKLTIKTCKALGKPYILNPEPERLYQWQQHHRIEVLNVAGNRESADNPDICDRTYQALVLAFGPDRQWNWVTARAMVEAELGKVEA